MMPCGSGWGFHPKQGLVTLPRFPQPLSAPAGSRVTRPLLRGRTVFNWYTCCASFGARWYRIDILAVNILWLYYVDISLSYFQIEFALWANYSSAIWLFVFCSQMVKDYYRPSGAREYGSLLWSTTQKLLTSGHYHITTTSTWGQSSPALPSGS